MVTLTASSDSGVFRFGLSHAVKISSHPDLILGSKSDGRFLGWQGWQTEPIRYPARVLAGRRTSLEVRLPAAAIISPGTRLFFQIPEIEYQETFSWPAALPKANDPVRRAISMADLAPVITALLLVVTAASFVFLVLSQLSSTANERAEIAAQRSELARDRAALAGQRQSLDRDRNRFSDEQGAWRQAKAGEEAKLRSVTAESEQARKTLEARQIELRRINLEIETRRRMR